ncbi:Gfo/Idh/MocA family oxidoreductase [Paenibacillus sp. N1-5-1-14]|uniref:Gfo/Idh/MocA family protein n=1 Tax=Paenibacillus radicibacter TaxID=2972488 RepID=UPI002158BE2D|nr:Gfo/Idh/MocA family oxidoreductase [Paenibacillus radicibacter]MCR8644404.1 Gfo/Idh/MocA family oxidoreductase [Paenibacillus radicibacter]
MIHTKKIRVGIIGTGFGASVQAPIFQSHECYEVKALASVHRYKSDVIRQNLEGLSMYTDWVEMIANEELDLVSIASSPVHHYEMALGLLEKGMHVLCEKPMGMSAIQTLDMLDKLKASNAMGFVDFQWRLIPIRQKIKEILMRGDLGKVHYIKYQGSFSGYKQLTTNYRGWDGRKKDGGGMLFAIGSHMFDSLMWWMNQDIVDVYAELKTMIPKYEGCSGVEERDSDDAFTVMGHYEDGTAFHADLLYPAVRGTGWKLEVYGSEGTLLTNNDQEVLVSKGGEFEVVQVEQIEVPSSMSMSAAPYYNGMYQMVDRIYRSISEEKVVGDVPTFQDGHMVQCVLDAIQQSSLARAWIEVIYE